jgi:autotransporter adhesin
MNKSYKSVWNESTGSWVAVSELATGRSKSKRAKTAISKAILTQIAVGGMSLAGASVAMAGDPVKFGTGATVGVADGIAIGTGAEAALDPDQKNAGKTGGIAIGEAAYASGSGVAFGNSAEAGSDSLAFGAGATATNHSTAIGNNAMAFNVNAVALGEGASAGGQGSLALGAGSGVSGSNSVALGQGSVSTGDYEVSVGSAAQRRQITNVADGVANNDAVNVGQLNNVKSSITNIDSATKYIGFGSSTALKAAASGPDSLAIGGNAFALGTGALAVGANASATAKNAVATERKIVNVAAGTTTTDAVNLGQLNTAISSVSGGGTTLITQPTAGTGDLLVGSAVAGTHVNFATSAGAARELINVAAGTKDTSAVNLSQLAPVVAGLGGGAGIDAAGKVTGPTYTIQKSTFNNAGDAFNKIDGSLTNLTSTVDAITAETGKGLVAQDATTGNIMVGSLTGGDVVDMTGTAGARKITGVAAGSLDVSSLDAINGSQLNSATSQMATAIGGGMQVDSKTGAITMPAFSVGGNTVYNVGDAITNLDGRTTSNANNLIQLQDQVTNITAGGGVATPNAVAYDTAAHDKLTLVGTDGGNTKLTGLQDGDLSNTSTDAVTGKQLNATNAEVASLSNTVQNIASTGTTTIGINGKDGVAGTAGAAGANGADAIAMGDNASASGDHAVVIGGGATGTADGVVVIGGNAGASGKDSVAIGNGATAPANNAVALGANSVADRDNTVSMGSEGNERQVTNVAAGTRGTDAVNLNQMNSALGGVARKAYSGIAAATALTMIPDVDANKTLSIGIGGGTFQGYAAKAIGGTARITQNIKVRVGAGWSAAGTTVGAGASYQW